MLKKVISGGQTGADRTGLECARRLGLETGGVAPKGWRTEDGPDPSLAEFGLVESSSSSYQPRTRSNVKDSEATVWFGNPWSPGGKCTRKYCEELNRPFIENPADLRRIAETYTIINIAGNRKSTNPHIVGNVEAAFATLAPVPHYGIACDG